MRQRPRSAFLVAPAILAITLTAAMAACGSTAASPSGHSAADPGGRYGAARSEAAGSGASSAVANRTSGQAVGTSTAAVPPAARRVQCPAVMMPLGRLPGSVQPNGPVQPKGPYEPAKPIPAGFRPVAVVECVWVTSVSHRVIRIYERRQVAVAGLGRLLAALRERSQPQPKAALPACEMPFESLPWFVLVSATGQVIRPVLPVGICGLPAPEVLASLKSLHWITLGTASLPVRPLRPPIHGGPVHVGTPRIDITPAITVSD